MLTLVSFRAHVKIPFRTVSYHIVSYHNNCQYTKSKYILCDSLLFRFTKLAVTATASSALKNFMIFFYRAMVLAMGMCLCLSVSVTSRSSTKKAKRRITQTTPHDSPGTLVFGCQRSTRNSTGIIPCGVAKCRCGGSKSATFDK